jgi:hypothetical protein
MSSWQESKVLVLLILTFVLLITTWTSGCSGFAEPLPQLSVTPSSLSVSTPVGSTGSQIVTVTNVGTTGLDVSEAAISGPGFSVAGVTPPFTLATGQSRSFTVKFLASAATDVDGSLSIVTDRRHRPVVVPLHGKSGSSKGVTSVAVSPSSASLAPSGKMQFSASIQGTTTNESVTWVASIGSITSSGLFTAPSNSGTCRVTATSVADPTKFASATVTVTATPAPAPPTPSVTSVTISPASASSVTGGTLPFTATVQGTTSNKAVTWTALLGSITNSGVYTAPAKAGTDTVTATSSADPTKAASAVVAVTTAPPGPAPPPPSPSVNSVTVSPASSATTTGGTLQFTAAVQGTVTDKSVSWKASLGSVSASGSYTAPSNAGSDTVTATSNADSSKSGSATVSVTAAAPAPPSNGNTVSLLKFGNAGFGGDDTSVFQAALNSTAGNGQVLEIPAGSYNISPISFPSNSKMQVDSGVTVSANSGFGSGDRMLNINSSNVTITGAGASASVFQAPKARAASQGDGSEYRHCLAIQGASNVTVTGISCNQSGGDGLYVSAATNVAVSNSTFDGNYRNGASVIGQLNHINISGNRFTNTNGTLPQAGVDIEPNNPADFVLDVNFADNVTSNNAGDGFAVSLWTLDSSSQPVGITVARNHSDQNGRYGYFANNNDPSNASGAVTFTDCTTDQSGSDGANARFYAATGASLTFTNLTVTNPHMNGPDPSYGDSVAVAIIRGGGGVAAEGNVHYRNVNVSVTNGKVDYYFDFHDGSGIGVSNVTFLPGTLSGASKAPPNGLLSGQTMNSVGQ